MRYAWVREYNGDAGRIVDELLDGVFVKLAEARSRYPSDDYSARVYACESCHSLHGCVAPRAELVDGYPCPHCNRPEVPWTDAAP